MKSFVKKLKTPLFRFWPALLIGGIWVWFFGPMMMGREVVGFRDSAYLYYPLFEWIDAQWAAGEIPLWNPFCNFGMPVIGDGSSSVFYPGKLVFFCRFLSYPSRYGIYLAMHVPLAAVGAYQFSRLIGAKKTGATLAAFAYPFGGVVLFQVTNVIYLVSAAWFPWAMICVLQMVQTKHLKWALGLAMVCAMMILGGDPQMVYHVGLISVVTLGVQWARTRKRLDLQRRLGGWQALILMAVLVGTTSLLSAVQLLPTMEWSRLSERSRTSRVMNFYQAVGSELSQTAPESGGQSLLDDASGVAGHAYQFSQPPWSVMELVWPNISGRPFPVNRRWTANLAGADRMWVPSLYAGLAVFILGILSLRFWGRSKKQVWLSWVFCIFTMGSFGWYGLVWFINEFHPDPSFRSSLGPQVGGVYWWMVMTLPKYFLFRYPAKLFVISSFAIVVLAAMNFHKLRTRGVAAVSLVLACLSFAGWVAVNQGSEAWFPLAISDPFFGPFDFEGSLVEIKAALLHTCIVAFVLFAGSWLGASGRLGRNSTNWLFGAVLLVSIVETSLANHWLVSTVPVAAFTEETEGLAGLRELQQQIGVEPLRIYRSEMGASPPVEWATVSSDQRLEEVVSWQRRSMFPKQHLGEDVVLLGSFSSIWPQSYQGLIDRWEAVVAGGYDPKGTGWMQDSRIHGLIKRSDEGDLLIKPPPSPAYESSALPIEWMFEFENGAEPFPVVPISEWGEGIKLIDWEAATNRPEIEITEFSSNRFVAKVVTDRPRVLGFYAPPVEGWNVTVWDVGREQVVSPDLLLASEYLPDPNAGFENLSLLPFNQEGEFLVEFRYQPKSFWMGASLSFLGWISVCLYAGRRFWGLPRIVGE
ncbi:MAG: hypothetical protein GY880_07115 [Planctomycetaceae bacterium]|nr:hypothetical protein [Planctomycetaceae bacterium]